MEFAAFTSPDILSMDKLSKWDGVDETCLAPLNAAQKDSFLELASIAPNRAMPIEVPLEEPVNIAHKVSVKGVLVPGSTEDVLAQGFNSLGMGREKIENAQQFYTWFSKIEEEMGKMEAEDYMEHVETLKNYRDYCLHITDDVNKALESLDKLDKKYVLVSTKTNALHEACEHLLADQMALINTADAIRENLEYFIEHDRISNKLSSTAVQVTGDSFQSMLTRIDECIEFMKAHPTYKDASAYMVKYKTCLSSALGMIKSYVVKSLESTTQSILNRKNDTSKSGSTEGDSSSSDDAFTLYYGKFRTNAPKIKGLMEQIEQRAEKNDEYQHLLSDIHYCYFTQRETLLTPSVTSAMTDLVNINKQDHCALVRSGCAFMVHVCEDEHQLYGHFFSAHSSKLHEMLLRLCGNLYDLLRPLIIHVYHLETLAELCTILKTEMIDDHVQNNPEQLQAFHSIALQMLEDVQERLVYRANIYIRDEIRGYKPSPGDVAYPQKLQMMEEIAQGLKQSQQEGDGRFTEIKLDDAAARGSDSSLSGLEDSLQLSANKTQMQRFQTSPADMHGMWFPTVRRVLVCLSKLYRCIDKTIFQGLSQEALEACVKSLVSAATTIKATSVKPNSTEKKVIDGQLFLIKHLLILREQIAPFHAEFAIRETQLDFSRTKDAAFRFVLEPRSIPNLLRVNSNNSLIQLMYEGTPEVKEFYIDSKKDVDRQLKLVCEEFIQHQTNVIMGPLTEFIAKASQLLNMSREDGGSITLLRQQQFATPEILHNLVGQVYRDLKLQVKKTAVSMGLYLANKETENILFKPIKVNVQHVFQQLHTILHDNYSEEDRAIIAAPSSDQVGIVSLITVSIGATSAGGESHLSCLLRVCFSITPCSASIFSMTLIGIDRYLTIMHPLKYDLFITRRKGIFAVVVVWILAILLGFSPLMGWGVIDEQYIEEGSICSYLYLVDESYIIFILFGLFLPQLALIIYLYYKIFRVSRAHSKQIARVNLCTPRLSTTDDPMNHVRHDPPKPLFTQSCPVSPVMPRVEISHYQARKPADNPGDVHSFRRVRNVSFGPASFSDETRADADTSSTKSIDDYIFPPAGELRKLSSVFDNTVALPGTAASPKTAPKLNGKYKNITKLIQDETNGNSVPKLRRTISYSGSIAISSFASQLTSRMKSYNNARKKHKRDIKALRTIAIVICFFFVMWSPFLIVSFVQVLCGSQCQLQNLVGTYLLLLGVANSAINPVVYTYTNRELKQNLCIVCRKRRQRRVVNNHHSPTSDTEASAYRSLDLLSVPTNVWHHLPRDTALSNHSEYSLAKSKSFKNTVVSVSAAVIPPPRIRIHRRSLQLTEMPMYYQNRTAILDNTRADQNFLRPPTIGKASSFNHRIVRNSSRTDTIASEC